MHICAVYRGIKDAVSVGVQSAPCNLVHSQLTEQVIVVHMALIPMGRKPVNSHSFLLNRNQINQDEHLHSKHVRIKERLIFCNLTAIVCCR